MNNWLRHIMFAAVAMLSMHAIAETAPQDTVYFYDSWEQIFNQQPVAMIINPYIVEVSPYEIHVITGDDEIDEKIVKDYVAISLGDSIWLVSSEYLDKNFKGNASRLDGFIPIYFNEKTAFITYYGKLSVKDILFGTSIFEDEEGYNVDYYYIDFKNHRLERVTSGYLSQLLEDYHDLQMRYEGMKDYKKNEIIEDYFFKYIDRATQDFLRPYILDLVE